MPDANHPAADRWSEDDAIDSQPVAPWSAEQVRELERREPPLSPWRVVAVQALVGAVLVVLWALLGSRPQVQAWSALAGAAAVVLPHALMAWGLRRGAGGHPAAALLSFVLWELMKMVGAVAILVATVWMVRDLSWPALLVSLIACLKVHVWALLVWGRQTNN